MKGSPRDMMQAATAMQAGEVSPVAVLEECLARIDRDEEWVRAWVHVDREGALLQAQLAESEIKAGDWRGPLHGIPIGIKDIVDVRGMRTLAGSKIRAETAKACKEDAPLVARLRDAGAVILGKTVTTEYACFDPPPTRNPWNRERTPGGSSSGSAAAVADRMCLGAIGSQTGGSITRPASYCGIAGLKPTLGRVSTRGVVPVAFSLDHPGPMAGNVGDLAIMLQAIAGYDEADPVSIDAPVPDYCEAVVQGRGVTPRLGLVRQYFLEECDEAVRAAVEENCRKFRDEGAEIVDVRLPESFGELHAMHRRVMCAEMTLVHGETFARRRDDYSAGIRALIEEGLALTAQEYAEARRHQLRFRREMDAVFGDCDALLAPAIQTPAPDTSTTGTPHFQSPWSYSGLPTVSFPVGVSEDRLPMAAQLVGRAFEEATLLGVAAWCERWVTGLVLH